jgi:uncharacterized DUF497 family protein
MFTPFLEIFTIFLCSFFISAKSNASFSTVHAHQVLQRFFCPVFFDPCRIETHDQWGGYGEDRWATLGLVDPALLYVVYTVRDGDTIRIISARKANEKERKQYRQANP